MEEMADTSTASAISCGLEKTTMEVFHPFGERQSDLKNQIKFMIIYYMGVKDVVISEDLNEMELTEKHEAYMNLHHELLNDFRVFYEEAGVMIRENPDNNTATRIKRIHKFMKDAKQRILSKTKPLGETDRTCDEGWLNIYPEEFPTDLIPEGFVKEWEKYEREKETSRYSLRVRSLAGKVIRKIGKIVLVLTPTKLDTRDTARRESKEDMLENPLRSSTPEGAGAPTAVALAVKDKIIGPQRRATRRKSVKDASPMDTWHTHESLLAIGVPRRQMNDDPIPVYNSAVRTKPWIRYSR